MTALHRLRQRFWFVPALLCAAAVLLAEGLVLVDEAGPVTLPGWAGAFLYRVGESGSRDILGAIAASSMAVAGTTFSITMAVLALTSSSYGPRLIRNFMADRGNQVVLGVYVATFLYSLLVLRSVRAVDGLGTPQAEVFVPHMAVNFAVLLAVLDVGMLIYFIHHISDSIQISTIARRVRTDLDELVDRLYPEGMGRDEPDADDHGPALPDELGDGVPVLADRPGYLTAVAQEELLEAAVRADVLVRLPVRPGDHVLDDGVLARVHPTARAGQEVLDAVRAALTVEDARNPEQDISFAVQQLTELAVRALSPGTNDPFTAINALDDLSSGLSLLARRERPSAHRYDEAGTLRVHARYTGVGELVCGVLDNMRWYAAASPAVMHSTLTLVERVGASGRPDVRARLLDEVRLLQEAFARAGHQEHDVDRFAARADDVAGALTTDGR